MSSQAHSYSPERFSIGAVANKHRVACILSGARMFGGSGGIAPRTLNAASFGLDLNGNNVTNVTAYNAALAVLRSPTARNPASTATWRYPPKWSTYVAALNASDATQPTGECR